MKVKVFIIFNTSFDLELSEVELINYLIRESRVRNGLAAFFDEMTKDLQKMLLKDRRTRKTLREKVFQNEAYYWMQQTEYQHVD